MLIRVDSSDSLALILVTPSRSRSGKVNMLTVEEALAEIIRHSSSIGAETVSLSSALGRVLVEEVTSGIDSPPFDKALMDGYAVRSADKADGSETLKVLETVTAGQVPTQRVGSGQATRIMTGAPMPEGADAVVPVEKAMAAPQYDDVHVSIAVRPGANVLYRGDSMKVGERIFAAGHRLRPQDLGVLAELGIANVAVRRRPRVAILATGDELVSPDETPGPGQIRNSNETLLAGLVAASGCEPVPLGIARDTKAELRAKVDVGLGCDMLLLSGGVSAGALDLVPIVLNEVGVEQVFHKVNVKPGKPVWFGVKREGVRGQGSGVGDQRPCLVFGLPGNPVSTLVCYELFAKAAIDRLMGGTGDGERAMPAVLTTAFENRGDRPTYHPAKIEFGDDGRVRVSLVRWAGSGDLRATVEANGVAVFEAGRTYSAGETVPTLLWSGATSSLC